MQEISVFITSLYQAIEVSPFATALIDHIYAQYQRPNAILFDDRVIVLVPKNEHNAYLSCVQT